LAVEQFQSCRQIQCGIVVIQVLLFDPILRLLIESNGGFGPRKLSLRRDDTILDEILILVGVGLGYKRGKIVGADHVDLMLVFHP
jgi:hypothetical protein